MVKNADLGKEAVAESARDDASDSPGVEPVSAPADSQNEPNAAIGPDQAEGLRSMFGDASARFLCLACALDGDTAVQMTMGMAHSLRQQQRVLYVDDIPLQERQKNSTLGIHGTLRHCPGHGKRYPIRESHSESGR